ncbi:hypothetical protein EV702DRAFT_1045317 [Suillus placidus]|uniref:Crinkler effector protein N-terminal domain-containing protein n=1 Tax=Suillus placidus TaxID=48579 RepID=A0A9P6ZVR8_9AGAM|nr:hypothetical protein EV702DRAFT_1045317 [Suillus placidus]
MSEMFTLYCWIRGTEIHKHFSLKISPTETVDKALEMPASVLWLYKPSLPVAEPFEASLGNVRLSELGKPLLSLHDISHLFNEPPPKHHIHIIVDAPQLPIYCWLRSSTEEEGFDISIISISSNASIGALKDRIKEDKSTLKNVDKSCISLFRTSGSDDDLQESLDTINAVLEQLWIVVQVYSKNNRSMNPSQRVPLGGRLFAYPWSALRV